MTASDLKQMETVLKALANRRRLAILRLLKREGEQSVTEIASVIKISIKAVSKHLAKLRAAGLVGFEQRSAMFYYSLRNSDSQVAKRITNLL